MSFLLIANNLSQYHSPIYKKLDRDVTVGFLSTIGRDSQVNPVTGKIQKLDNYFLEGINYIDFKNYGVGFNGFFSRVNISLLWQILIGKWPSVMVHGHSDFTNVAVLLLSWLPWISVYWRGEAVFKKRSVFTKLILQLLVSGLSGAIYSHEKNRLFLRQMGVRSSKLFFAPSCVDNDFFNRSLVRNPNDFGDSIVFIGKFVSRKNIIPVLGEIASRCDIWEGAKSIVVAGGGELKAELASVAMAFPKGWCISILDFVDQKSVRDILSRASVLMLPSTFDSSPKIVHEALSMEVRVILSSGVQTAHELAVIAPEVVTVVENVEGRGFSAKFVSRLESICKEARPCASEFESVKRAFGAEAWIRGFESMRG